MTNIYRPPRTPDLWGAHGECPFQIFSPGPLLGRFQPQPGEPAQHVSSRVIQRSDVSVLKKKINSTRQP